MIALHQGFANQMLFPLPLTLFVLAMEQSGSNTRTSQRMAVSRVVTQGPTELKHKDLPVLL